MTHGKNDAQPCCPKFNPEPWDGRTLEWKNKPFILRTTPQIFHMPLLPLYARTVARMWERTRGAGAALPEADFLLLAHDPSPWKSELYMATATEVPGERNVTLSGTFFCRVFDGPYRGVPKWIREVNGQVAGQGRRVLKYYIYFTTCPKCARIYGHNYSIVLAETQ